MPYKIEWIGVVGLSVTTKNGRSIAFSLEEGQQVPEEFQVGDDVDIANFPSHPAQIKNTGYYEITHIRSGKVLKTMHRADEWKVK